MRSLPLLALMLLGCPKQTNLPLAVEPEPAWTDRAGRERALMELATTMVAEGAAEQALSLISQMRQEGIKGEEVDVLHARALAAIGLLDDAQSLLEQVIDRHPRNADAHHELGIVHMDRRSVEAAIPCFERAVELRPEDPRLQNNLGFALLSAGRAEEASKALRASLRLDSTQERTRNNLGYALVAAGKENEAWRVFRSGNSEADAHFNLGYGLELRGRSAEAREHYLAAQQAEPGHRPSREGLDRLPPPAPAEHP